MGAERVIILENFAISHVDLLNVGRVVSSAAQVLQDARDGLFFFEHAEGLRDVRDCELVASLRNAFHFCVGRRSGGLIFNHGRFWGAQRSQLGKDLLGRSRCRSLPRPRISIGASAAILLNIAAASSTLVVTSRLLQLRDQLLIHFLLEQSDECFSHREPLPEVKFFQALILHQHVICTRRHDGADRLSRSGRFWQNTRPTENVT